MIFFRSRELLHENLKADGDHKSIVFTFDHNAFLSPGQKVSRTYYSKPGLNIVKDPDDSEEESDEEIEFANTSDNKEANKDYNIRSDWKKKKRRVVAMKKCQEAQVNTVELQGDGKPLSNDVRPRTSARKPLPRHS